LNLIFAKTGDYILCIKQLPWLVNKKNRIRNDDLISESLQKKPAKLK